VAESHRPTNESWRLAAATDTKAVVTANFTGQSLMPDGTCSRGALGHRPAAAYQIYGWGYQAGAPGNGLFLERELYSVPRRLLPLGPAQHSPKLLFEWGRQGALSKGRK